AEFDVGVFLARLLLGEQPPAMVSAWLEINRDTADESLVLPLAGVEIIRRLIGYAQLPLRCGLATRTRLLRHAAELIWNPALASARGLITA
ncbi:MAG TPA: hypothetical protein PKE47_10045, partial [Verrucomicrobiota bacterium]|nr:hypothetical protein [Verrucomicrobiota bacterium]